jgi:hypothetical protein
MMREGRGGKGGKGEGLQLLLPISLVSHDYKNIACLTIRSRKRDAIVFKAVGFRVISHWLLVPMTNDQ